MDLELEELESLFSEHFGRTPLCTPVASQEDPPDHSDSGSDDDEGAIVKEISVDELVNQYLQSAEHSNSDNDEDILPSHQSEDDSDMAKITRMKSSGCRCQLKCDEVFASMIIYDTMLYVREMDRSVRDMYIMNNVTVHTEAKTTKRGKKRQRNAIEYYFHNKRVCRVFFMMAFDIGKHGLENLLKHYSEHGAVPRTHGNVGKKPSKSLRFSEIKYAMQFIVNHSEEVGLPQPAAARGRDDTPPIYLPSDNTKKSVHEKYSRSCDEASVRSVSLVTFRRLWNSCLPHIKIASPRDDVCGTCEKIRKQIMDAVTEESKLEATNKYRDHILLAQKERELYNECIKRSKETQYAHFTFDFSQNVSIPHV